MERERWERVYRILVQLDKGPCRGIFRVSVVLGVYFWAVINDRPISWACCKQNWPPRIWESLRLPSQATMSRRLRAPDTQSMLAAVGADPRIAGIAARTRVKIVDAKPLTVGACSKDPDSAWGYAARGMARGYKLFAIWGQGSMPLVWQVAAMNVSEQRMAERMIPQLPGKGYLLGDRVYDINKLYDAACAVGHQLLADRKRPNSGLGHRPHSAARLRAIALLRRTWHRRLYARRTQIERYFGGLTAFGGGLAPLPSWVRRLQRVRLWIHAKLIVNALRINDLQPSTAVA